MTGNARASRRGTQRLGRGLRLACSLLAAVACGGADPSSGLDPDAITLSVPFPGTASAPIGSASGAYSTAGAVEGELVYVSLVPGTVVDGRAVTILNRRTGGVQRADIINGGFDPVAIHAQAEDVLDVVIERISQTAFRGFVRVAEGRRPIIVRTNPPPKKRDVPLNERIIVVFSEPVDPESLTPTSIQLTRFGSLMQTTLTVDPARPWEVLVTPQALTAGDYELAVSQQVRGVAGGYVANGATVAFSVAATNPTVPSTPQSLFYYLSSDDLFAGTERLIHLEAQDAVGRPVGSAEAVVTSSNPAVVTFGNQRELLVTRGGVTNLELAGRLKFIAPGTAVVTVTLGSATHSRTIEVLAAGPLSTAVAVESFTVVEYRVPCSFDCPYLAYAPLLRLRETTGGGPATIVHLEFTVPDQAVACYGGVPVAAGQSKELNPIHDYLWFNNMIFVQLDGIPLRDGVATARAIVQDANGNYGYIEATAPIQRMVANPALPRPDDDIELFEGCYRP